MWLVKLQFGSRQRNWAKLIYVYCIWNKFHLILLCLVYYRRVWKQCWIAELLKWLMNLVPGCGSWIPKHAEPVDEPGPGLGSMGDMGHVFGPLGTGSRGSFTTLRHHPQLWRQSCFTGLFSFSGKNNKINALVYYCSFWKLSIGILLTSLG